MLLMIDNYDSFTYNLVQHFRELGQPVRVVKNDQISIAQIDAKPPKYLVISPGPGTPENAGITVPLIQQLAPKIPILGVCLGHQSIAHAYGGKIVSAQTIMHGKTSPIHHTNKGLFTNIKNPFKATRYHSLLVEQKTLPSCLEITAWTTPSNGKNSEIMGIRHKMYPTNGVQFHPESILTAEGKQLLKNFLSLR